MHVLVFSVPTLAVAAIYCIWWRAYSYYQHRERTLRERVAYMLWVMAHEVA